MKSLKPSIPSAVVAYSLSNKPLRCRLGLSSAFSSTILAAIMMPGYMASAMVGRVEKERDGDRQKGRGASVEV